MARTADFYTTRALEALNAGFTSKSGQQAACADVTSAYEFHTRAIHNALLADRSIANWDDLYWGLADYPHNWKAKHSAKFAAWPTEVAAIEALIELRNAIKAAPVNAPARAEPHPLEVKARETLQQLMERRGSQYERALDLGSVFGRLPVSATTHWCVNEHGTRYLRTFFYLRGEFTALNIIIAAAEELERRAA